MKKYGFKIFSKTLGWSLMIIFFAVSCQDLNEESPNENDTKEIIASNGDLIPGKYIVVLHDTKINYRKSARYEENQASMRKIATDISVKYKVLPEKITRVYTNVLSGFAIDLEDEELQLMRKDPSIKYIEQDAYGYASFQKKSPPGKSPKDPSDPTDPVDPLTSTSSWGLDRIDQRSLPLDQSFSTPATGKGVTVYIMDSGILTDHQEFQGRAFLGYDSALGELVQDCHGHGTHVAGIVGGATTGVARDVELVSVKVLGTLDPDLPCEGRGAYSQWIDALDWIIANAKRPAIVNMSLQGGKSDALNTAIDDVYYAGIPVIVAAGNYRNDASLYSPASAEKAFTVGASASTDQRAGFSNFGDAVKLFAPGENILSASINSTSSFTYNSGTSMATPYAVGVAALFLETNPTASPQQVYDFLMETSTKNKIALSGSVNNHLLFSGLNDIDAGQTDPNQGDFELIGTSEKFRGGEYLVNLNWSPIVGIDTFGLYVDGVREMEVQNYGITLKVSGGKIPPKTYQICVPGTSQCTNTVTVSF